MAAAEAGSFAGAAQRVHASPSTVTERMKQLEARLGAQLFTRDKRGCSLTAAGEKFLGPAAQAVRAWEFARLDIALPEKFTRSVTLGGQYFLWDGFLMNWLSAVRKDRPDLAWRVTAGASARLNRDLAEGGLDFAVLHDPVFRRDVSSVPLSQERLILVTGGDPSNWREDFVNIEWGRSLGMEIASRLEILPQAGLVLDLGRRSAHWLADHGMAGYMPSGAVQTMLADGDLQVVSGAPSFDYPCYACWRRDFDQGLAKELVGSLKVAALARGNAYSPA